ncbi:hypothetical protein TWF718_000107 [Orbilia javanica]|uniref:Uncharacterized protein n=1 Tax=Orbilia javanica TaxID=47235 RepID=A0AAN8NE21_9PEZI
MLPSRVYHNSLFDETCRYKNNGDCLYDQDPDETDGGLGHRNLHTSSHRIYNNYCCLHNNAPPGTSSRGCYYIHCLGNIAPITQTTYTLIGGVQFWKRDNVLVARGPKITTSDCTCVNVECMTAVATTEKVTITSVSTVFVTKATETVSTFTTITKWKTKTLKLTLTTLSTETISMMVVKIPVDEASTVYDETSTVTSTTFLTAFRASTQTTTVTADASVTTDLVSFTQIAYFPTWTMLASVHDDGPVVEGETQAFAVDACATWCANKPECLDWAIMSDNGWPFGTKNPPTRYCIWFDAAHRYDDDTGKVPGRYPWLTDSAVWQRIE